MKRGSIIFWFIPCRIKVPGIYGFQISGAGIRALWTRRRIPSPLAALSDVVVDASDSDPAAGASAGAGAEHAATQAMMLTINSTFKTLSFMANT
jgi:hypothetical protein